MLLACQWQRWAADLPTRLVRNALSISGLFELDSIRRTPHLQVDLRLTPSQARKSSPAWLPSPGVAASRGQLYSVAGGDESPAFLLHNQLIRQAWGRRVVPVCEVMPGLNHFSMLGALAQTGSRVNQLALALLANHG
jgi:arylformamidase